MHTNISKPQYNEQLMYQTPQEVLCAQYNCWLEPEGVKYWQVYVQLTLFMYIYKNAVHNTYSICFQTRTLFLQSLYEFSPVEVELWCVLVKGTQARRKWYIIIKCTDLTESAFCWSYVTVQYTQNLMVIFIGSSENP
jgi:hypothetical protein